MTDTEPRTAKSRDEIARAYSSPNWLYDIRGFLILTFAYRSTLSSQIRLFGNNMGERHLEVAIGTGTLFGMIYRRSLRQGRAPKVIGFDYAESMLAGARQRFAKHPNIELLHADVADIPIPEESFDTVNIANSVHCFPDVDAALREVARVLRPGGRLAANVLVPPRGSGPSRAIASRINRWGIDKGILVSPYEPADIRARVANVGLELAWDELRGNTFNFTARKPTINDA